MKIKKNAALVQYGMPIDEFESGTLVEWGSKEGDTYGVGMVVRGTDGTVYILDIDTEDDIMLYSDIDNYRVFRELDGTLEIYDKKEGNNE